MTTFLIIVGILALFVIVAKSKQRAAERRNPALKLARLKRQRLISEKESITKAWQEGRMSDRDAALQTLAIDSELSGTKVARIGRHSSGDNRPAGKLPASRLPG